MTRSFLAYSAATIIVFVALIATLRVDRTENVHRDVRPHDKETEDSHLALSPGRAATSERMTSPLQSIDGDRSSSGTDVPRNPASDEAARKAAEEKAREVVARRIQANYSLLISEMNLSETETERLLAALVEYQLLTLSTEYAERQYLEERERQPRLLSVLGDARLRHFLELERNLSAYGEAYKINRMLEQNGAPLSTEQVSQLVEVLVQVKSQSEVRSDKDGSGGLLNYLEDKISARSEFERHVLELAPSVLTPKQTIYLHEQYEFLSYQRANSLESQRWDRRDSNDDKVLSMPLWAD